MKTKRNMHRVKRVNGFIGLSLIILYVFLFSQAFGFAPTEQSTNNAHSTYIEGKRSFALRPTTVKVPTKTRAAQWKNFAELYGNEWTVRWNPVTGTPARISGGEIATGLSSASSDKSMEAWARDFVAKNKALLGINPNDLRLLDLRRADGHLYLTFRQIHQGLQVYGSVLKMNINHQGDLVLIASNCFPNVTYKPHIKLLPEQAARRAIARIYDKGGKAGSSKYALRKVEKVIFPMPAGKNDPFRLCYLMEIHLDNPRGDWVVVIDAKRGVDYVLYNNYRFGTISGTVTGNILPAYYDDAPVSVNFENENIHVFAPTPVYAWYMNTNPGWTTQASWAWGVPNGVGGDMGDQAPTSGYTGSNVYAYNLTGGYDDYILTPQYLTTTAINCSGLTGTHLSFWRWLGVEYAYYDQVSLEVSNDGTNWITIWHNLVAMLKTSTSWERVVYDISAVADGHSTVYIRWGMGPTDIFFNYCGWYIDDVEIYANGGTSTVSAAGTYSVSYSGSGNELVYAEMSGPYSDVYYEDSKRLSYTKTVPEGINDWSWIIPPLTPVLSWDLSMNPGWTTQSNWAYGMPLGNAGDPTSGHTGLNVYGYNLAGAYENDIDPPRYLTTTAINCSTYSGTHLRFWRWLGVEWWDYATIEVSNNGTDWVWVYINMGYPTNEDTAWTQVTYDISAVADGNSTVYIRWGMGPTDFIETYCGWNIDDIEILADSSGSDIKPGVYDYDEVNVFHHMNVAYNSIKSIDPGFTGMDYKVPAAVRIDIQYANAFWDGEGINFGEGDEVFLRNTALFSDVIYHEYNHGITHQIYPSTMLPYTGESGAMDEGWSDYFACNITDEPLIGEGDLVIGEPYMRNLDNTLRVPDDWVDEVHDDGRIIGGAMWDLREALGSATASQLIHFARYNLAEAFFDYYEDVLITDDDNANLNDGTPNMNAIAQAFGVHGIGGLQVENIKGEATVEVFNNGKLDAGETGDLLISLQSYFVANNVQANLTSSDPYITIHDGFSAYGNFVYSQVKYNYSDPLAISISPTCPEDEILDLALSLTEDGGYNDSRPITLINAPDQILYDEGVAQAYLGYGWTDGGFAVRFTPPVYPVIITAVRLWPSPYSAGVDIDLHVWNDDGPGGSPNTELIPAKTVTVTGIDSWQELYLSEPIFAVVYQWDMNTNPGWSTQGGWAFGTPTGGGGQYGNPDPTSGATGTNVYGYNLSGDYPNNMASTEYLQTTAINCSSLTGVHLRFQRWLGVEDPWFDHAYIEVSNDGSTWIPIWENASEVTDSAWTQVTYDISAVADGQPMVYIRWGMGPTDESYTCCGWNIDDVQILQVTGTSGGITVTSGDIYLGWTEGWSTYYNGYTRINPDQRSWVKDVDLGWVRLDSMDYDIDMLVRARYFVPSTPPVTEANPHLWSLYP